MAKTRFSHPAFSKDLKPLHGHLVDFQLGVAGGSGSLGGLIGFGHEKFSDLVEKKQSGEKEKHLVANSFHFVPAIGMHSVTLGPRGKVAHFRSAQF